jgi:predicted RNase H-like HicB family nuclease
MAVYYAGFIPSESGYAVLFPDFPGCNSEGATLEEAVYMACEALTGHIGAMLDDGDAIPAPLPKEEAWKTLCGQFAGLGMGSSLPEATELHPVPVQDMDMRVRKVAVSFSGYRLNMIDHKAKTLGMTRSGFLAMAAEQYALRESGL